MLYIATIGRSDDFDIIGVYEGPEGLADSWWEARAVETRSWLLEHPQDARTPDDLKAVLDDLLGRRGVHPAEAREVSLGEHHFMESWRE